MRSWIAALATAGVALIASGCVVLNATFRQDGANDIYAGELRNLTGADILWHNIAVEFLDDGDVVDTQGVPGCLRSLQAGAVSFFEARSELPAVATDDARGFLVYDDEFTLGKVAPSDIAINQINAVRTGASLTVTGNVRNDHEDLLSEVAACVVVYDSANRVVRVGRDATLGDLAQGANATFDVTLAVPDSATDVDRVDVWADGLVDGVPAEPEGDRRIPVDTTATPTPTGSATATPVPSETAAP
jgi:hypothetical protein